MRKWMRERLQRRKKKADEQAKQPAPAPLQPAYFDSEVEPAEPEATVRKSEPAAEESQAEAMPAQQDQSEGARVEKPRSQATREKEGGRGRGRRRRGGRGRGGRGREAAVAQAFAPGRAVVPEVSSAGTPEESGAATLEPEVEPAPRSPQAPPTPVPPVAGRPPKGVVVLAIGLPGSGKSSWFKRHNVTPLSSDMVRSLLFDDVREQRFQDLVFSNLRSMLKARLIAKRPMNYVDATNLTPQERQHWVKLAKDYNYEVHAVFFDVPLEVCIERHQRRDRVVPEDAMRRMAAKLKPPSFEEGFAKITVVRVKKKTED